MNLIFLKKIIPKKLRNLRHLFYAWSGATQYNNPSEELFVIGVTGTSGKSTTIYLLKQLLENAGHKVGALSTIEFCVAGECELNDKKMTMLGKMEIQKRLRDMVDAGCDIAIIETTSEGRLQHRHRFINYDVILLTNLWPEHIESHGSFRKYKRAKLDIFKYVAGSIRKNLKGKKIEKTAIVNREYQYWTQFLNYPFDQKIKFGKGSKLEAKDISVGRDGLHFKVHAREFHVPMYGEYNISNILAVMSLARVLDIPWSDIQKYVSKFKNAPGRIEFISEAEEKGFQVIVDYAFEPRAMEELYKVVDLLQPQRIIHVLGSTGGGRDKARRFTVGEFVGKRADICIITDEDPYDDDPMEIINDVAGAVEKTGKKLDLPRGKAGKDLFKILDRKEAIAKALSLAKKGDLVLITGKGSEQKMCVSGGKMIDWDDRRIVRENLAEG